MKRERRASALLVLLATVCTVGAAALLVSRSLGRLGTTSTDAAGRTIVIERPTPSILEESPGLAVRWIAASVVGCLVLGGLVGFGRTVGPVLVICVMGLVTMASILTIGAYLAPGAAAWCGAASLAIAERAQRTHSTAPD